MWGKFSRLVRYPGTFLLGSYCHRQMGLAPLQPSEKAHRMRCRTVSLKKGSLDHSAIQRIYFPTLMLGKIEDKRIRGWQRMRQLDSISHSMDMNLSKLLETVKNRGTWCAAVHGVAKSWTWLRDWTITTLLDFWRRPNDRKERCNSLWDCIGTVHHSCSWSQRWPERLWRRGWLTCPGLPGLNLILALKVSNPKIPQLQENWETWHPSDRETNSNLLKGE